MIILVHLKVKWRKMMQRCFFPTSDVDEQFGDYVAPSRGLIKALQNVATSVEKMKKICHCETIEICRKSSRQHICHTFILFLFCVFFTFLFLCSCWIRKNSNSLLFSYENINKYKQDNKLNPGHDSQTAVWLRPDNTCKFHIRPHILIWCSDNSQAVFCGNRL